MIHKKTEYWGEQTFSQPENGFVSLHIEFTYRKFYQPVCASEIVRIPKIIHWLQRHRVNILWVSKLQFINVFW